MKTISPRDVLIASLLRQVSLGLSAYRLFPGDLNQRAFTGAVERIGATVGRAIEEGPVHVEVLATSFRTVDGDVPNDQHLQRLASILYARRVEHLHLHRPPAVADLAAFYRALSVPEAESIATGGVAAVLGAAGVTSITAGDIEPEGGQSEREAVIEQLDPEQLDLWRTLRDPQGVAASILLNLRGSASDGANQVYSRLRGYGGLLPPAITDHPDFMLQMAKVVEELPPSVRREVEALLITRAVSDPFAEQYIGNLTDTELARTLVALGQGGGPDPVDLAQRVVDLTGRRADVITLTQSLQRGDVVAGQVSGSDAGLDAADDEFRSVTADLMSSRLVDARNEDVQAILEMFPLTDGDWRALSLLALQDYLGVETEPERLRDVLEVWSDEVRRRIAADELDLADRLLAIIRDSRITGDASRAALAVTARDAVLTPEFLSDLVAQVKDAGADLSGLRHLLTRFGPGAVDGLFGALAEETDRGSRALMVSLLGDLGAPHVGAVVDRLADPDWHVVRNAATALGRIGGDGARAALQLSVTHAEPKVRRESLRSLAAIGGAPRNADLGRLAMDVDASVRAAALQVLMNRPTADAARAIAGMVRLASDPAERRRGIAVLGGHGAEEAGVLLRALGSLRSKPRLPRPLRKHARTVLKARQGTTG